MLQFLYMSGTYVYPVIIGFALGIALYSFFDFGLAFVGTLTLLACALLLVNRTLLLLPAIVLLALALGAARMHVATAPVPSTLDSQIWQEVTLTGIVADEPDKREKHTNLVVQPLSGEKVLVRAGAYEEFAYGDEIQVTGKLEKPKSFAGGESDGRVFNYPRYLAKDGIYHTVSYPSIETLSRGHGNFIKSWLFVAKSAYLNAIEQVMPEPASALAGGITVGAKKSLGKELEEDFRKTGIIHIVVLSGYNVMIIATFLLFLLSYFSRSVGAAIGAVLIVLFAIMTGAGATVVRASAMGLLALFAAQTGRTYDALRALAIVGFVMLLWNPKILIADISFQLSFVATLGLIFGLSLWGRSTYTHPNEYDQRREILPNKATIREILVATIATQIAVLPLILYYMGDFSLVAIAANVLVLPVLPFAMLFSFLAGLVGLASTTLSVPIGWIAYILLEYMLSVVDILANLPFAAFHFDNFSFIWIVAIYFLFAALLVSFYRDRPVHI